MDALKAQLARMQQQLGALTMSQKMLAGSLVAVMVLTLLFWGRYAGTSEMEPVLDQTMKADEIGRITARVRAMGLETKVVNDRVLVPADRKLEILAALSYDQLVPQDTRGAYEEIIKTISPWGSSDDTAARRNDAKSSYLAMVIRKFPGVSSADVIIDPTNEHRLGGAGRQPTATVQMTLRDPSSKPDKSLVQAAAATVAGAQAGLAMNRINVVVNGATYPVSDRDSTGSFSGDEMLASQQQAEHFYSQKIQDSLSFISGALVSVTVDLNIESESRNQELYDPTKVAQKESKTESETTEGHSAAPANAEAGAVPNSAMTVGNSTTAAGEGPSSSHEKNTTTFENKFTKSIVQLNRPAGKAKVVKANVSVPRSYFVNIYKTTNPSAKDPDDAMIQPLVAVEMPKIRNIVKACTYIQTDDDISVASYTDVLPVMAAVASSGASSNNVGSMLGTHYKEIGVGVLALVSLFMVSSMVKRHTPAPVIIPSAIEPKETPMLSGGEDLAGDVGEGNALLDGMELDDDAVRAQQMVDQVATMVKENPEAAAGMVKRWLNK